MPNHLSLFASYQDLPTVIERQNFALANPRLLWIRTIKDLSTALERRPPVKGVFSPLVRRLIGRAPRRGQIRPERLLELDRFRLSFRSTDDYPIGPGPLDAVGKPGKSADEFLARSLAPEILDVVAPPYLQVVAFHGEDTALRGNVRSGLLVARCAAEAALALADRGELDKETFNAVTAYVQTSVYSLCQELDVSVQYHALEAARRAIIHAELLNDHDVLGKLHQAMGALRSDIWIVPGHPRGEDTPADLADAITRSPTTAFVFEAPPASEPWLAPQESLRAAVGWYRCAIPYRQGVARGLSYKAIVQTEDFIAQVFGEALVEEELKRLIMLAAELLTKHSQCEYHMKTLRVIAERRGWPLLDTMDKLPKEAADLLAFVEAAYEAGADSPASERRREGHATAMRDLRRVLKHKLPWALYLRNFDFANDIRLVGDVITERENGGFRIVVPQISYSIVDHKVLELFGEGVVTVCDPGLAETHLLSTIPRLSLRDDAWLPVVHRLAEASAKVVLLLDSVTPGVEKELKMLQDTGSTDRTLIVRGQSYRNGAELSAAVADRFPFTVDWLDFSHDERHFDMRHKAHRIVQDELVRFVQADARQIIMSWLKN